MAWDLTERERNVHHLKWNACGWRLLDWEAHSLLISDVHFDSPYCDRDLLRAHLDLALKRQAPVIIAGDMFDVMQGKGDPRSNKAECRSEYVGDGNYFDLVIEDALDFFQPYADILAVVGYGNHEISVSKHYGTDLIERFTARMRERGSRVRAGGYWGFLRYSFANQGTASNVRSFDLYYNHGWGGGGAASKGVPQFRQIAETIDADILFMGHNHKSAVVPLVTARLSKQMHIHERRRYYVRCPGYKSEWAPTTWISQRGGAPSIVGGWWLHFYRPSPAPGEPTMEIELLEAR